MLYKMVINDFKKSKLITSSLVLFIAASAMLLSLSAILFINLSSSIDAMMDAAKTPHFMQMHTGDVDIQRLNDFAKSNVDVSEFQLVEFINIEAENIMIGDRPLENVVQDNGIVKQNPYFDYLLDLDNHPIEAKEGQIYVPLSYYKDGSIQIGDTIKINGHSLVVKDYLRDSQMNSALSSSKRFLVHEKDFDRIKDSGSLEYLIEFRLNDLEAIPSFERDYVKEGLESNGPTLTYPLFKMINGISDGLMMAVILIISFIVVIIAFLCIRFTLLARLDDDYREIGVLKAVGLYVKDIKGLYLVKYLSIASIGGCLGFILALLLKGPVLENIRLFMGISSSLIQEIMVGLLGALFILVLVLVYVIIILRRIKKVSVTEAIRFGMVEEPVKRKSKMLLSRSRISNTNVFLALKAIRQKKKLYLTMAIVIVLSVFIISLPANMYHTMDSDSFISYMGVGLCDLRIDVQQVDNIEDILIDMNHKLDGDNRISKYAIIYAKSYTVRDDQGNEVRLKIELGDHSIFPIEYILGRMPEKDHEIALSAINAEELGLSLGDQLTLIKDQEERFYEISGVYSDLTNGGKTAKAIFSDDSSDMMWGIAYADVADSKEKEGIISDYKDWYPNLKVSDIDGFIDQTFGMTKTSFKSAANIGGLVALFIVFLITVLFIRMLVIKERYKMAVLKAIGFTTRDLKGQFLLRAMVVTFIALILGILFSLTLGERVAEAMISSFGVRAFKFKVDILFTYGLLPLGISMIVGISTLLGTKDLDDIIISQSIKE